MKKDIFQREKILIGEDNFKKINKAKIIIYGIGGVGSFVTEGLVRAGVQNITLVDNDVVDISNINRQIEATTKTVGKPKIDVMRERLLDINPDADVYIPPAIKHEIGADALAMLVKSDVVNTHAFTAPLLIRILSTRWIGVEPILLPFLIRVAELK